MHGGRRALAHITNSCLNVGSSGTTAMTMASTTGANSDTSAASIETATTASALTGAQK